MKARKSSINYGITIAGGVILIVYINCMKWAYQDWKGGDGIASAKETPEEACQIIVMTQLSVRRKTVSGAH